MAIKHTEALLILIILAGAAFSSCPDPYPAGLAACADAEEPDNADNTTWAYYLESGFDQDFDGKKDRFIVDSTAPYDGQYSLRTKDPNDAMLIGSDWYDYMGDSFFVINTDSIFGSEMSFGDEVFIRYSIRFPENWQPEATDENGGANHLRVNGVSGIEATFYSGTWFHWYDSGAYWLDPVYVLDGQWHRYSIYLKMPTSDTSPDGIFRMWRDASNYSADSSLLNLEGMNQTGNFSRIILTPCYYKGPVSANWTFWLDDIEVWDRIAMTDCNEGQITSSCYCNGTLRDSGYCCNGVWNENACLLFHYGFEDWKGSIADTADYPVSSNYEGYCVEHEESSEVVISYENLSAHRGDHFLLHNHWQGDLDPPVEGISQGSINWHANIGLDAGDTSPSCGNNDFSLEEQMQGKAFLRFWYSMNGWENCASVQNCKLKLVRFLEPFDVDILMYMVYPEYYTGEPLLGIRDLYAEETSPEFADGGWHRISMYADYDTGEFAIWFDEMNETLDNALIYNSTDAIIAGAPGPSPIVLDGNWCSFNPEGEVYTAIDDIEVWDGIPSASDSFHDADTDQDGTVDTSELLAYVGLWKAGDIRMNDLFTGLEAWK